MRPFSACLYVLDVYIHTHSLWCWWWWLFLNNYSTRKTGWFALVIFIDPTAQSYVNGKQMCAIFRLLHIVHGRKVMKQKIKGDKKYWSDYVYIFYFFTSGHSRANPLFVFKQSQQLLASRPWNKQEETGYCCWLVIRYLECTYLERGGFDIDTSCYRAKKKYLKTRNVNGIRRVQRPLISKSTRH
jgi:hypothetical protein